MDNATPDLDAIRARLSNANGLALDESVARWYRTDIPTLLAALDEARAEVRRLRGERGQWRQVAARQTRMERDFAQQAESRADALEATLATVRAEHTRDRERLAKVEDLIDWHETKADKARQFRPEINGENAVMDKAAEVHDTAARRLRAALATTSEEVER